MIRLSRRTALPKPDARATLLGNSLDTLEWHKRADPLLRFFLGVHCESQWREFLRVFGSTEVFAAASVVEQTEYIKCLVNIGNDKIDAKDEAAGRAVHLISAYLGAITTPDAELERELRAVLDTVGQNIQISS